MKFTQLHLKTLVFFLVTLVVMAIINFIIPELVDWRVVIISPAIAAVLFYLYLRKKEPHSPGKHP